MNWDFAYLCLSSHHDTATMGQTKEKRPDAKERILFYPKDAESVLADEGRRAAQELLQAFVEGKRGAFGRFRSMFEKERKSSGRDKEVEEQVGSYMKIVGRELTPEELRAMRELCGFLVYYRMGRGDANAASIAFAEAERRRVSRGRVPRRG